MISIPRAWADTDASRCNLTYTAPPRQWVRARCSPASASAGTVVWLRQAFLQTTAGHGISTTKIRRVGSTFTTSVGLPATETVVVITADTRPTVERLASSVRTVPSAWVVVPDVVGTDPGHALATLAKSRLVARVNHNSGLVLPADRTVVNQQPTAGEVVRAGSRVTFSVLPDMTR